MSGPGGGRGGRDGGGEDRGDGGVGSGGQPVEPVDGLVGGDDWVGLGPEPGLSNVLFGAWLVSRATTALVDAALRSTGLDADEFAVYSVLRSGDGLKPTELAAWMAAPPTTVSSYVRRFEKRGHVVRVPDPDDGRSYRVQLTDAGRNAHLQAAEQFGPLLDEVTAKVGADGPELMARFGRFHRAVTEVGEAAPWSGLDR